MYRSKEIKDSNSGFRYQKASILKEIPESNSDIYIEIRAGDNLGQLANKYYGADKYWRIIALANNLSTIYPKIGTTIRIPQSPSLEFIKE